eukprot:10373350-Lingulodinium_polyedra.AAC.1
MNTLTDGHAHSYTILIYAARVTVDTLLQRNYGSSAKKGVYKKRCYLLCALAAILAQWLVPDSSSKSKENHAVWTVFVGLQFCTALCYLDANKKKQANK